MLRFFAQLDLIGREIDMQVGLYCTQSEVLGASFQRQELSIQTHGREVLDHGFVRTAHCQVYQLAGLEEAEHHDSEKYKSGANACTPSRFVRSLDRP